MIKFFKTIVTGFFIALIKRGLFIIVENFNKKSFSEIFDMFLNKEEILWETVSLIIIYYMFVLILKKI